MCVCIITQLQYAWRKKLTEAKEKTGKYTVIFEDGNPLVSVLNREIGKKSNDREYLNNSINLLDLS